jgi:thioredoxin:protein disulfide reductase
MCSMTGQSKIGASGFPLIQSMRRIWIAIATLACLAVLSPARSISPPPAPLPVDEAFPALASERDGVLTVRFDVLPGHYLFGNKFEAFHDKKSVTVTPILPKKGVLKDDPNFGKTEVFTAPVTLRVAASATDEVKFSVRYQGCSEIAGVCYPPTTRSFVVRRDHKNVAAVEAQKPGLGALFRKQVSQ